MLARCADSIAVQIDGRGSTALAALVRPDPAAPADHRRLIQAGDEPGTWLAQGGER